MRPDDNIEPVAGFLVGMAVGDALGLPREGLSADRARRRFGPAPLEQSLILGRGMVSDDTEHLRMTAVALLRSQGNPDYFTRELAWQLRLWLLMLPAGVGRATARAIIRLWLGYGPTHSGVASAGNGPAMRAGILGLCIPEESRLRDLVRISTRLTHTDPRAETGAFLMALAVRTVLKDRRPLPRGFLAICHEIAPGPDWEPLWLKISASLTEGDDSRAFAERCGWSQGVRGDMMSTMAAVIFCALRWPGEFRRPLEEIISMGGDTDTTAALLGGLTGAAGGIELIPSSWVQRIVEWPYSLAWFQQVLARQLSETFGPGGQATDAAKTPPRHVIADLGSVPATLVRNMLFLIIVLCHGFWRLIPDALLMRRCDPR